MNKWKPKKAQNGLNTNRLHEKQGTWRMTNDQVVSGTAFKQDGKVYIDQGNGNIIQIDDSDHVIYPLEYVSSFDGSFSNFYDTLNSMTGGTIGMAPVLGDLLDAGKIGSDFSNKNYGEAGIGAGLLLLPNILQKPLGWAGRKAKNYMGKLLDNIPDVSNNSLDKYDRIARMSISPAIGGVTGGVIGNQTSDDETVGTIGGGLTGAALGFIGGNKGRRKLVDYIYKRNQAAGRAANDLIIQPISTLYYRSKGDYNFNRAKTFNKYKSIGKQGVKETYNDFKEQYPYIGSEAKDPEYKTYLYQEDFKKKYPGADAVTVPRMDTKGVISRLLGLRPTTQPSIIESFVFRNPKSNLPYITSKQYKGNMGHEALHAISNSSPTLSQKGKRLTIYDSNIKYDKTNPEMEKTYLHNNTLSSILKGKRFSNEQYSNWANSPEEVMAEFQNFKRTNNLTGSYKSLSEDNKDNLKQFLSNRFNLSKDDIYELLKTLNEYYQKADIDSRDYQNGLNLMSRNSELLPLE